MRLGHLLGQILPIVQNASAASTVGHVPIIERLVKGACFTKHKLHIPMHKKRNIATEKKFYDYGRR